jgi:hypothetical protein
MALTTRSAAVVACTVVALGLGVSPVGASGGESTEQDPALISIEASSAKLVRRDGTTRLRLSGVAPKVTFQSQGDPRRRITAIGAINLLAASEGDEAATVRPTGDGRHSYGLRTGIATYNPDTKVLTAEVEADPDADDAPLQPEGNTDQELPSGPVELTATVPDAEVTATGAPQSPAPQSAAPQSSGGSSYSVAIQVNSTFYGDSVYGTFVPGESTCTSGSDFFAAPNSNGRHNDFEPASSFNVDTSGGCFFKSAVAVYRMGGGLKEGGSGPRDCCIDLKVTQVGPRYFVSSCTDKFPIKSSCGVVFAPVAPTVRVHI